MVRPRDAASLVLVRQTGQVKEILMGRRASGHRFLPGHYVFPGGQVDPADHRARLLEPLRPEVERRLSVCCSLGRARAIAVAAVRETYEETGLLLGRLIAGRLEPALSGLDHIVRAITPTDSPIRFHARFFLADIASASGTLRGNGELLDLAWRPIDKCLKLPIADITEFVLRRVEAGIPVTRTVPVFAIRAGRVMVRY